MSGMSMTTPNLIEHIGARSVQPRPDCLLWAGATDRGYGRIFLDGTAKRVHRVVWELQVGPIPDGLTVDHLCRVTTCINTDHMELVTASENSKRGKRFLVRTHCQKGHELTPENTRANGRCHTCHAGERQTYNARRRAERAVKRASP